MPRPPNPVPVLRHHKPTNQAVTTVRLPNGSRKDLYLGRHGSPAAGQEYARVVALVAANGGVYPAGKSDLTVNEALVLFLKFAVKFYVNPDGSPSRNTENMKSALRPLRLLFGPTPLAEFGPPHLKAVREAMVREGRVRRQVNKRVGVVRQFFRWCVEEQLVPVEVLQTLKAVAPLSPGRSGVAEGEPREPADPAAVEKSLPHMPPPVRAVVQLLRATGARPTEVLVMRPADIDRSGDVWKYAPASHKSAWRGKGRVVFLGPDAQAVLAPWLADAPPGEYLFSPAKAEAMRMAERAAARKTPRYPSHMKRNARRRVADRKRKPAARYDYTALGRAVARACERAGVAPYSPYQLRHLKAVELRERFGLESVRAVLGQTSMAMAEHYARRADEALATKAAEQMG